MGVGARPAAKAVSRRNVHPAALLAISEARLMAAVARTLDAQSPKHEARSLQRFAR